MTDRDIFYRELGRKEGRATSTRKLTAFFDSLATLMSLSGATITATWVFAIIRDDFTHWLYALIAIGFWFAILAGARFALHVRHW